MDTFFYSCKEAPIAQYEMTRVRIMMRNHRIFQNLGIGAIASILRTRTVVEEGSAITNDESASAITQGESSDYNPKDDGVIDGEEVDDILVEKNAKVQISCLLWRGGIICVPMCLLVFITSSACTSFCL